ncbi:MAG: hypothetical protein J5802_13865 [Butyrivibrio sp.]|nr:hypothetical protein [Butyrivibrio sp.]
MSFIYKAIKFFKDKFLQFKIWDIGAILLFAINMIGILYFDFSDLRLSLDPDFAVTVYHLREMVDSGTPVLRDWFATTSMEYDSVILFAAPIYALTGNEFFSVGLANLMIVILYIFVIWNIFSALRVNYGIRLLTLSVIITPYSYDWLDYFKMLFFAHANYSIKAIIPLLLILCLIAFDDGEYAGVFSNRKRNTFLGIYLSLLFVTCASTGIYTIACGLAPIFIIRVISFWKRGNVFRPSSLPVWLGSGVVAATGVFTYKLIYTGFSPVTSLVKFGEFAENFRQVFVGVFQVFGALISGEVPVFSMMGIYYCLKICFVISIFILTILAFVRWLRGVKNYDYYIPFFSVIVLNLLILILGDMRAGNDFIPYRYLLIGIPVLLTGLGIMLQRYVDTHRPVQGATVMMALILVFSYILAGNFKITKENMMNKDYIVDMTDYFKTLDADTVFIMDDKDTALMCKSVDDSKKYACVNSEEENITLEINYYNDEKDFDYYGDKNIIAIPNYNKLTDYVPEDVASNYTYVGEARWLACYRSDTNYFKEKEG